MKQLLLLIMCLLSFNSVAECMNGLEPDFSGKFCVSVEQSDASYDVEDAIDDCEDEVRIQHGGEVESHELVNMMLECREELGQR